VVNIVTGKVYVGINHITIDAPKVGKARSDTKGVGIFDVVYVVPARIRTGVSTGGLDDTPPDGIPKAPAVKSGTGIPVNFIRV
jgi:hypothetical protein